MNLKSLLLSSDERTVRILRRVLSDLEITVEHCNGADDAIRRITRERFEGIIVDGENALEAADVLRAAKAAPVNKRALTIALVEASVGLKGGFAMGAHFVLHKPFAVERAKASFRAVRALMKRERRLQMRVPVQIPVECFGSGRYKAITLDLSEGGMAIKFIGRIAKENTLRFSMELPGMGQVLEIYGEPAWEGSNDQVGVRFKDAADDQCKMLRKWVSAQLPESGEADDPPVNCLLAELSAAGCYLTTNSPFPRGTRVTLSIKANDIAIRAGGLVLVAHPEFGMGVEFLQATEEQREQSQRMIATLRASTDKTPSLQVEPECLERPSADDGVDAFQANESNASGAEDPLVELFRQQFEVPVASFLKQMREKRASAASR